MYLEMFQLRTEKLNELGFYQIITDTELIKDLKTRMGYLNMRSVGRDWRAGNHFIITTALNGEQVQLLLTTIMNIPVSVLYLVRSDKFVITGHRFHPSLYNNTVLFGDLFMNHLAVHAASFGGDRNEKTAETLERLDAALFNKLKEDLDLEPIRISIKEFYEKETDIVLSDNHKALIYLNAMVRGQHFIKFK
jgi:hypothetical protein